MVECWADAILVNCKTFDLLAGRVMNFQEVLSADVKVHMRVQLSQ